MCSSDLTFPGGVGGVSVGESGRVYTAVCPENDRPSGVYAVESDGDGDGTPELLGAISDFPNDLLVEEERDRLLVTESSMGAVYSVSLDGDSDAEPSVWSDDSLLAGEGFGANGLTVFGEGVLVANTGDGRLVSIPIEEDGGAGEPEPYVEDEGLLGANGITAWGAARLRRGEPAERGRSRAARGILAPRCGRRRRPSVPLERSLRDRPGSTDRPTRP